MRRVIPLLTATAIGLSLALASSGAALAQSPGYGPGPGYGMMGRGMMGGWQFDQSWFDSAKHEIGIRPDQEKAWTGYVDAVRDNFKFMQNLRQGMDYDAIRAMTPEQRYNFMLGMHKSRQAQMNSVFTARSALFSALDAAQREKASAVLIPGFYGRGMGRGMMGGGMGPGGPLGRP